MGKTRDTGFLNDCVFTDSSNNVGIGGAANASYKFAVTGNTLSTGTAFDFYTSSGLGTSGASGLLRVVTAGTSDGVVIGQSNNARYVGIGANQFKIYSDDYAFLNTSNNPLYFGTNNLTRLSIAAAGNINIETNNVALTQKNAAGTGTIGLLRLGSDNKIQIGDGGTANPSVIYFPNGNVGIGTSSPSGYASQYLNIYGSSSSSLRLTNSTSGTTNNDGADIELNGVDLNIDNRESTGVIKLLTNDTERMRIRSTGEVGINTGGVTNQTLRVKGFSNTSSTYPLSIVNSIDNDLLYVRSDGYLNVGTAGSSPYNNTYGNAANAYLSADGSLGRSTSSLKYKENVTDYSKGLNEVMQLRPVSYTSKNEKEKGLTFAGLIAEEVYDLGLTEFVQYAEDGTPDALSYQNMVALLTKAIQEQNQTIEELKDILKRNNLS